MMTETTETNELFELETPAAVLAFYFKHYGEAGARELLAATSPAVCAEPWALPPQEWVRLAATTREAHEDMAKELESLGIGALAVIVRQHAATRPDEVDVSPYPPGSINHRAWLRKRR